jgi:AcrR family transcriptional regulator
MSPRPDKSPERKQQILEAAIAVFARLGFRAARMEDVAEQARLSKGALYLYYKSKDAIIAALLQHLFTQEFKQLQASGGATADPHEAVCLNDAVGEQADAYRL